MADGAGYRRPDHQDDSLSDKTRPDGQGLVCCGAGFAPMAEGSSIAGFFVIAAAEIFFQPDVGADKKIAAAHLLDL